jgi:hypothetical protein
MSNEKTGEESSTHQVDIEQLALCADLPRLFNEEPPVVCPICGARRIEPEDSGLALPEGAVVYGCLAAYAPTRQDDEIEPVTWEALPPCWEPSVEQVLSIIHDWCAREAKYEPVAQVLAPHVKVAAPALSGAQSAIWIRPHGFRGQHPPTHCIICGLPTIDQDRLYVRYACQSLLAVRSERPTENGSYVPTRWGGELPCRNPPLHLVLTVLARHFPVYSTQQQACLKAARLLEEARGP